MTQTRLTTRSQEKQIVQRLLQLQLFEKMGGKQVSVMLTIARRIKLDAAEFLWRHGDRPAAIYVLLNGTVALLERDAIVSTCQAVDTLGEVPLLGDTLHETDARTQTDCVLLELGRDALDKVFASSSDLAQRFCRNTVSNLSRRLQHANQRAGEIARERAGLEKQMRDLEIHLNDMNTIRRMRG